MLTYSNIPQHYVRERAMAQVGFRHKLQYLSVAVQPSFADAQICKMQERSRNEAGTESLNRERSHVSRVALCLTAAYCFSGAHCRDVGTRMRERRS
jgi:hypothetical protein